MNPPDIHSSASCRARAARVSALAMFAPSGGTPTSLFERPPPGLERGAVTVPAWLVVLAGALALLVVLVFYARLARRRRS